MQKTIVVVCNIQLNYMKSGSRYETNHQFFYGISGARKTTLAKDFCREYGNKAKHVELDHYYNTITTLDHEERMKDKNKCKNHLFI